LTTTSFNHLLSNNNKTRPSLPILLVCQHAEATFSMAQMPWITLKDGENALLMVSL